MVLLLWIYHQYPYGITRWHERFTAINAVRIRTYAFPFSRRDRREASRSRDPCFQVALSKEKFGRMKSRTNCSRKKLLSWDMIWNSARQTRPSYQWILPRTRLYSIMLTYACNVFHKNINTSCLTPARIAGWVKRGMFPKLVQIYRWTCRHIHEILCWELLPQPVRRKMWSERSEFAHTSAFRHGNISNP